MFFHDACRHWVWNMAKAVENTRHDLSEPTRSDPSHLAVDRQDAHAGFLQKMARVHHLQHPFTDRGNAKYQHAFLGLKQIFKVGLIKKNKSHLFSGSSDINPQNRNPPSIISGQADPSDVDPIYTLHTRGHGLEYFGQVYMIVRKMEKEVKNSTNPAQLEYLGEFLSHSPDHMGWGIQF